MSNNYYLSLHDSRVLSETKTVQEKTIDEYLLENYIKSSSSFKSNMIFYSSRKGLLKEEVVEESIHSYSQKFQSLESARSILKSRYIEHISNIELLHKEILKDIFYDNFFKSADLKNLLDVLNSRLSEEVIRSFTQILKQLILENKSVHIDKHSLLNYLYILPSKKIQKSDIAIDNDTGNIIIFYNANQKDFESKKITIMANKKDFTVSIISRKDGLAKFSGMYASMFPEAYYKIEYLLETLI